MKTVAVFFGGKSNEHEISIITGLFAANLLRERYRVIPVYISREGALYASEKIKSVEDFRTYPPEYPRAALEGNTLVLYKKRKKVIAKIDVALNCCHGGAGEDGTLSALLHWNGVASASPDTALSSIFMNKELGKIAARGLSIPVVEGFAVHESEWKNEEQEVINRAAELGYPLIVKPSVLGSSIGIKVAKTEEEFSAALRLAFRLDTGVVVEKYLADRRDMNCAAYRKGGETVLSPCEEVFSDEEILTFSEKYEGTGARNSQFPAQLPEALAEKIQAYTKAIYESFSGIGVVRADFFVCGEEVYFNELNTVPGSLACYLFGASLTENRDFLISLIEEAKPAQEKETVITGILSTSLFTGGKSCKRR